MKLGFRFSRLFLALLSALLIAFLLASTDTGQVASTLSQARLEFVAAALASAFFAVVVKTARWGVLLAEKKSFGFRRLFLVQASGLAVSNLSPGKLLEPVKVLPLKQAGVSYGFLAASVFWERAFDLMVLFAFALGGFSLVEPLILYSKHLFFIGILLLLALAAAMFRNSRDLFRLAGRLPFLGFFEKIEAHNFRKRSLALALGLTLVAWLSDFAAVYFSFSAVGFAGLGFLQLASAFSASVLAGTASFLPGGFGSTEAVFGILVAVGTLPTPQILAGVFLSRITTIIFTTLAGLALLPLVRKQD